MTFIPKRRGAGITSGPKHVVEDGKEESTGWQIRHGSRPLRKNFSASACKCQGVISRKDLGKIYTMKVKNTRIRTFVNAVKSTATCCQIDSDMLSNRQRHAVKSTALYSRRVLLRMYKKNN
jgi:hypothetical protein